MTSEDKACESGSPTERGDYREAGQELLEKPMVSGALSAHSSHASERCAPRRCHGGLNLRRPAIWSG